MACAVRLLKIIRAENIPTLKFVVLPVSVMVTFVVSCGAIAPLVKSARNQTEVLRSDQFNSASEPLVSTNTAFVGWGQSLASPLNTKPPAGETARPTGVRLVLRIPASALMRLVPVGEPQPVQRS